MQLQVQTVLNRVHRFKSFVYSDVRFIERGKEVRIEATIEARRNAKSRCPICHETRPRYDRQNTRCFEFIPLWGIAVFFLYAPWRVNCPEHRVLVEAMPWSQGKFSMTRALMCFLASWAKRLSWWETAKAFGSSWDKVRVSVQWVVEWGLAHRALQCVEAIGIDEVAWRKGHKYLTLVYDISAGTRRLLWIGDDRRRATINGFFEWFGKDRCQRLRFVCTDMWKPYLRAIQKYAAKALNILDRFHIAAHLNKALDETRRKEAAAYRKRGNKIILKHARWSLLKRVSHLTERQAVRLKELPNLTLRTTRAYLINENFDQFWRYSMPFWADRFLAAWCDRAMRSRIEPLKKVALMLRKHQPLILNYFHAKKQYNSGVIEGLNNKVRVVTKRAYGYRKLEVIKIALYHALGDLPSPPTTHRFF